MYRLFVERVLRFSDIDLGLHIDIVIPGKPVLVGELVRWIAHHLIETGSIHYPLTAEDVEWTGCAGTCDAHDMNRSVIEIELRRDPSMGCNGIWSTTWCVI